MIVVLPVKSSLGSSLDYLDVMGYWLGSGQMVWVCLQLVVLDMMVRETWRVPSMVSRRLRVNLWSCGCVPTLNHMSPLMN
jgi:hypothetical protein